MRIILTFCLITTINIIISSCNTTKIRELVAGYKCAPIVRSYIVSIETIIIYRHVCGGSLIGSKWVLSAAHCRNKNGEKYVVVAGLSVLMYRKGPVTSDYIQESEVQQWYIHPHYSEEILAHDVCLLKLRKAIDQSSVIKHVPLYLEDISPSFESDCSNSLVLGFGSKDKGDKKLIGPEKVARHLRCTNVSVISDVECMFRLHFTHFCAMEKSDLKEVVNPGDSGGPLLCNGKQIGIVSGYAENERYILFVRIYMYKDFIYGTMASASCKLQLSTIYVLLELFVLKNKIFH